MNARVEIWFLSDDRISILVETAVEDNIFLLELLEIMTFAAMASGVIANLPKDVRERLCRQLTEITAPEGTDDIPTGLGDWLFVLPGTERGSKGFEGTLKMKDGFPTARWKPRGFRLFGREVQDYSEMAVMALVLHTIGGLSPSGRAMLRDTAHTLGRLGLLGQIGMRNHASVAKLALDQAFEAEQERGEGNVQA